MTRAAIPARNVLLFWAIALGGMAFDLATKSAIFAAIPLGDSRPVVGDVLELRPSRNHGALWGFGADLPYSGLFFAALSIVAGVAIVYWLFARRAAVDGLLTAALALIMAGAIGNCYDRLAFGYVRDFAHFHVDSLNFDFAIFNFADNMLVLGAAGLMLLALRPEPATYPEADPDPEAIASTRLPEPDPAAQASK